MSLGSGARVGPYEIVSQAGAGGMGEVYKARDTRLNRTVAIKVLPANRISDPHAKQRLEREAKVVAALSHPHICSLFDIGHHDEIDYLVMEFLEGETLAQRLTRGKLPLDQALQFGIQIADALAVAHTAGIIHRDLKPSNIMLTRDGAKLLDFGLAKPRIEAAGFALTHVATQEPLTGEGSLVGTLQYMSPEQLEGRDADARSDVFGLGAVLYEMATGRRAFEAGAQASLIAKILETEPAVVSSLAPLAPPALDHLVAVCLAKPPEERWQAARDVKLHLEWIRAHVREREPGPGPRKRSAAWVRGLSLFAAGALAAASLFSLRRPPPDAARPIRVDLSMAPYPQIDNTRSGAISPDGQWFVFEAAQGNAAFLALKHLASATIDVLAGTEGGAMPFWAPDGQSFAFFHPDNHLKQVVLAGRGVRVLAETRWNPPVNQGSWQGNVILFTGSDGRLYRIPATGGTPSLLQVSPNSKARAVQRCQFLPDGRHFLLWQTDDPSVYVASVDAAGITKILPEGSESGRWPAYGAGYLLYPRGAATFARPFDPDQLQLGGPEVQLPDQGVAYTVSRTGTIAYSVAEPVPSVLTWVSRDGNRIGTVGEPSRYSQVVLSPGGRHATVVKRDTDVEGDLWDIDFTTGVFSRLTTAAGLETDPSWSPDERALVFTSNRMGGRYAPFIKDLVNGKETLLVTTDEPLNVDQWTPDGRFVIARMLGKAVYAVPMSGPRTPKLLVDTPSIKDEVHVSPDGRSVAFDGDESGAWEVYVAAFPSFSSKRQVSNGGGVQPQWRADGRELFYLASDGSMMSLRIDTGPVLAIGRPSRLFQTKLLPLTGQPQYAVTADGQRFLAIEHTQKPSRSFTFLVNWLNGSTPNTGRDLR